MSARSILSRAARIAVALLAAGPGAFGETIGRYGVLEKELTQSGDPANPYTGVEEAHATLAGPRGREHRVPLFWDGGDRWVFRFSPERTGRWRWTTRSDDPGLDGESGTFRVVASDAHGGIEAMPEHPHHFQRQDATPFYFLGDTAWALYTDHEDEEHDWESVRDYIDTRAEQGFSVVHSMLLSEAGWSNRGGPGFDSLAEERVRPAYWQEVDRRVRYIDERGIVAGLVLAWADKGRNPNNWQDFPSQEARERYARYIAARYSAYDVYFVVSGEWNAVGEDPGTVRLYDRLGEVLARSDPHERMVAIHPHGNDSVRRFAGRSWMDFADYQQIYRDLHGEALRSRRAAGKPVVNAEYAYFLRDRDSDGQTDKSNSATLGSIRHATWDIAMAGAYCITGFGSTYFGGNRHPGPFDVRTPENDPWEEDVQHLRAFFCGIDWWRLAPHDELVGSKASRGDDRRIRGVRAPPATTYWALADPPRQYVLYVRGTKHPVTLTLGDRATATYALREFDPRTGQWTDRGAHEGPEAIEFSPRDERDRVLLVTRQDRSG